MKTFVGNNLSQELYKKAGNTHHSEAAKELRNKLRTAAGVTPVLFGRWVSNKSQPSLLQATALCQELAISLDDFVVLADSPK